MITTSFNIPKELLKRVKHAIIDEETTMGEKIRELLEKWVDEVENNE